MLTSLAIVEQSSKFDRFSLLSNLPAAVNFAKVNLSKGKTLLICCHNGKTASWSPNSDVSSAYRGLRLLLYYIDYQGKISASVSVLQS